MAPLKDNQELYTCIMELMLPPLFLRAIILLPPDDFLEAIF